MLSCRALFVLGVVWVLCCFFGSNSTSPSSSSSLFVVGSTQVELGKQLLAATEAGDLDAVKALVKQGAHVDYPNTYKVSWYFACIYVAIIYIMLDCYVVDAVIMGISWR